MPKALKRCLGILLAIGAGIALGLLVFQEPAQTEAQNLGRETGSPVPRFVSLEADLANIRSGPGLRHRIKWVFKRPNIPLEVMAEFGNWRKIRDFDGATGWIHSALLEPARTAWVAPWKKVGLFALRSRPKADALKLATVEPKVLVRVDRCNGTWCSVAAGNFEGYMRQRYLWGVYPNEKISDYSIL